MATTAPRGRRLSWSARSGSSSTPTSAASTIEADGNGNLVAWWRPDPQVTTGGVVTGSHLDSVPDGGAFDGPLGVVTALAAIDLLRDRGVQPARPIGVATFREEEGARFGLPCLGSRLMTGVVTAGPGAGAARPRRHVSCSTRWRRPASTATPGPSLDLLQDPTAFVELHVEQGRGLVDLDRPVAVASAIWPHGRWRFDVRRRGQPRRYDADGRPA